MKKGTLSLLIALLMFVTMGADCDDGGGIPNPGFRLVCVRVEFGREAPLQGARTDGTLRARANNASGTRENFFVEAGNAGQAPVANAVAPGLWRLDALDGWRECDGKSNFFDLQRGVDNYVACTIGRSFGLQFFPYSISTANAPVEFKVTGNGLSAAYGMPTIQFFNSYGTLAAQTRATTIAPDNLWIKGWSGCLSSLPTGDYSVNVVNATANGAGQLVGTSGVRLYGANQPPTCNPSSILIQRCMDNGGEWDYDSCSCA